jgi:hypothetical protein
MSDVQIGTEDAFTLTLVQKWFEAKDQVDNLDEKMAVESFGRTKLLNTKFDEANPGRENKKANNDIAVTIRQHFDSLSDDQFAGLYETVRRVLKEYDKKLDNYVDKSLPKVDESDKPKPEELAKFREDRKTHVDNMNGIRTLLEGTAPDWFKAEGERILPKLENLRGAVGGREKTGKRLGGTFRFTVDPGGDTETILSDTKLGAIPAYAPFKKAGVKNIADVKKAIMDTNEGFDWDNPPTRFEFVLAGRKILANKVTDESSEDDESENDINELTLDVSDDDSEETKELFDDDEN